ncbi:MAG: hypothetical protein RIC03_07990, partial [Cyclobacteriaceae bacterium]
RKISRHFGGFSPIVQDNFLPHLTTTQKTAPNFLWCGQSQIFFPKYPISAEAYQHLNPRAFSKWRKMPLSS